MNAILNTKIFAITLTFVSYFLAQKLYKRYNFFLFNPVLLSITTIIIVLKCFNIEYKTYSEGGNIISFMPLAPGIDWPLEPCMHSTIVIFQPNK